MKQIEETDDEPRTKVEELVEVSLNDTEYDMKVLVGVVLNSEEKN